MNRGRINGIRNRLGLPVWSRICLWWHGHNDLGFTRFELNSAARRAFEGDRWLTVVKNDHSDVIRGSTDGLRYQDVKSVEKKAWISITGLHFRHGVARFRS